MFGKLKEDGFEGVWDAKPEKLLGVGTYPLLSSFNWLRKLKPCIYKTISVVNAKFGDASSGEQAFTLQVKTVGTKKPREWEKYVGKEATWPQFFYGYPSCEKQFLCHPFWPAVA